MLGTWRVGTVRELSVTMHRSLIRLFVRHPLAANLTMALMLMAGIWAITNLNVGLNPAQPRMIIEVAITWRGASAEDIEKLITNPVERQLRSIRGVNSIRSISADTWSSVRVEMNYGEDLARAVDDIKQRISQIRGLPPDIEPPAVFRWEQRDLVSAVLVRGNGSLEELIPLVKDFEADLRNRGADIVQFAALPAQELAIQVDSRSLYELGRTIPELGGQIAALSQDAPGGTIGNGQSSRQIRSLDQRRDPSEFAALPIVGASGGGLIHLGDIAHIEKRTTIGAPYASVGGAPAVQMMVRKGIESDALEAADILHDWVDDTRAELPEGISISLFLEAWSFIRDELNLIMRNGVSGLILVILALLIFLQLRVAFWVMVGIPVTFALALFVFYFTGSTINALSLIGMVMALGIVVDDAIVVGEESLTQFQNGKSPAEAATLGAQRMFAPVLASSLTTACAFLPLLLQRGEPIIEIPILMICVIAASIVECFIVLPGHLRHAFEASAGRPVSALRRRFNGAFEQFREQRFRPMVRASMRNRRVVIGGAFAAFALMTGLWMTGWIKTNLNLNINFDEIQANVEFVAGTSDQQRQQYMLALERALSRADETEGAGNVTSFVTVFNSATISNEPKTGPQYASILVEMTSPEQRQISADDFALSWSSQAPHTSVVESISIRKPGEYWADFAILLKGADAGVLKAAAEELIGELGPLNGVSNLHDDLPYGKQQWIFSLTPEGRSVGLTTAEVGRQLRGAYDGQRIQILSDQQSELEVRVILPEHERNDLASLGQFPIKTPAGHMLPLASVATWEGNRGINIIRHHSGQRTIKVSGDVDLNVISGREVVNYFDQHIRDGLLEKYAITSGLDDLSLAEQHNEESFQTQFLLALALIYVVLAWVFASYAWPLAIMAAIPLGPTGALAGHVIMGMHIGPMSLLGLFTLTGIIVNDSIIIVSAYKHRIEDGVEPHQAIEDAVCSRLRAVILTSLTTIAGLFPLMLEQAPIGAAFTPLAAAICFGMLYGTVLVLLVIPALLSSVITITQWLDQRKEIIYASLSAPRLARKPPEPHSMG